ncbi:L-glyceraldehyde 3-phosphate reductase [Peribacillus alkalitolerans]|uniref:L-glyceraldehyde 3-phosphate reductase n=1 Tax=Peribacillus alkalitolerans TaxID=1550385 RepID=UPI0013D5B890|nr:L-glyceraldehyde 3-phosphate reductase [Peribacillus alkalitolerans]
MVYQASGQRYQEMQYQRCGNSGLKLPAISLGLWHNFGSVNSYENMKSLIFRSFDLGITHFDLANNYGPVPGSAEENFGKILHHEMKIYRDEMIISTKAGYTMWDGPYGDWGSKKYLVSSLDQSLKRMGLEYVDIFYHHRPDPETPMEETMAALDLIVRQGKALYVGISNYSAEQTAIAVEILNKLGTPLLIHQPSYSMFNRWIEDGLQDVLEKSCVGSIAFSPLAQGMLTGRYLKGIPADSRAGRPNTFLQSERITESVLEKVKDLNSIAVEREQSLAQMALAWVLREGKVTSAIIGASRADQIEENVKALNNRTFTQDELNRIDSILSR